MWSMGVTWPPTTMPYGSSVAKSPTAIGDATNGTEPEPWHCTTGAPPVQCHGSGSVPLVASPMAVGDFATLLPYGIVVGGHVTPIDHMYFYPADWPGHRDEYDVHAIADGQ